MDSKSIPRKGVGVRLPSLAPAVARAGTLVLLAAACGRGESSAPEQTGDAVVDEQSTGGPPPSGEQAVDAAQPEAALSLAVPAEADPAYPRVVLVTIDTLRADHLPSYGYPRDTAPFFSSLAREGVLFRQAFAAISHTAPSHASILTGLPPSLHGVRENGHKLSPDLPGMAELFGQAGFESAAFVSVGFLRGVAPGFAHVQAQPMQAAALIDDVITWLREVRRQERFLLWVHLYEPHRWKKSRQVPEAARRSIRSDLHWEPEEFYRFIAGLHGLPDPPEGEPFDVPWKGAIFSGESQAPRTREELLAFIDDYDALIRDADGEVRRLYSALEELALPGATLWILTSDHGEGLGSHGYAGHGARLYNEQLHVPLLFHATDGSLAAREVDGLVLHLDLLPTLAEFLGASVAGPRDELLGRSLVPLLRGERSDAAPRFAWAEKKGADEESDEAELFAIQDEEHKLIRHQDGREEFFALSRDPLELEDLPGEEGGSAREALRRALEERLAVLRRMARAQAGETPPEWLDELRELGYVR